MNQVILHFGYFINYHSSEKLKLSHHSSEEFTTITSLVVKSLQLSDHSSEEFTTITSQ